MKNLSDQDLMLKVKNDNLQYAKELFYRYQKKIYNFFLKMTFDKELSNDLTQNVFYRIIKYKNSFKTDSNFKPWIYQMARNILNDHYRMNKLKVYQIKDDYEEYIADEPIDYKKEEQIKILYKALNELKPEQKEMVVLSKFQKLSYAEIAESIGCSEGALKVRMHRTMQKLKEIVEVFQNQN